MATTHRLVFFIYTMKTISIEWPFGHHLNQFRYSTLNRTLRICDGPIKGVEKKLKSRLPCTCTLLCIWIETLKMLSFLWLFFIKKKILVFFFYFLVFLLFLYRIAKRLGLRSKSFGKKEDRFITIARKFDAQQLIDELIQRGGSTEKYDLIAPTAH